MWPTCWYCMTTQCCYLLYEWGKASWICPYHSWTRRLLTMLSTMSILRWWKSYTHLEVSGGKLLLKLMRYVVASPGGTEVVATLVLLGRNHQTYVLLRVQAIVMCNYYLSVHPSMYSAESGWVSDDERPQEACRRCQASETAHALIKDHQHDGILVNHSNKLVGGSKHLWQLSWAWVDWQQRCSVAKHLLSTSSMHLLHHSNNTQITLCMAPVQLLAASCHYRDNI